MKRKADVLSIVEAAYAVDASAQAWTRGLLEAADQSLGTGLPGFACLFELRGNDKLELDRSSVAVLRQTPEALGPIFDGLTRAPPPTISSFWREHHTASLCLMTSEFDPESRLPYRARLARDGVADGVNVVCMDLDRSGILISLGVRSSTTLGRKTRADLTRVATHMLAGIRLRRQIGAIPSQMGRITPESADAVLSPDGKVLHAQGEARLADARRTLQSAVHRVERARTTCRADPRTALRLWKGLVSARWSLVESFEARGTRYIVARENAPRVGRLSMLTPTESCVVSYAARGFSTKEIAYTLGISDATVRVLVTRAVQRCALRDKHELFSLARSESGDDPG